MRAHALHAHDAHAHAHVRVYPRLTPPYPILAATYYVPTC